MLNDTIIKMKKLAGELYNLSADLPTPDVQKEVSFNMLNPTAAVEKRNLGNIKTIINDLKAALDQYKAS